MEATAKAFESIKKHEGCRLKAYKDSRGRWTVGYGATGGSINSLTVWTQEKAEQDLKDRLKTLSILISPKIKTNITQNQFDALLSFVYNIGIGNFAESGVLKLINQKKYTEAADRMLKWNKARVNGELVVLDGLTERRERERALFLS